MMNGFMFNGVKFSIKQIIYNIYIMGVDWSDNITREMIANQFMQIDNTKIVEELQENVIRLETKVDKLNKDVLNSNTGNGIVASPLFATSPADDVVSSPVDDVVSSPADDVVSSPDDDVVSSPVDDVVSSPPYVVSSPPFASAYPAAKQRRYSPTFVSSPFMDSPVARSTLVKYPTVTSHPFETSPNVAISESKTSANSINNNNSDKSKTSISNSESPPWLNSEAKKIELKRAVEALKAKAAATRQRTQKNRDTVTAENKKTNSTVSRLRRKKGGHKNKNTTRKNKHHKKK